MPDYRPAEPELCPTCGDFGVFLGYRWGDHAAVWLCLQCDFSWPPAPDDRPQYLYNLRYNIAAWHKPDLPKCSRG